MERDSFVTLRVTHQSFRVQEGGTFVALKGMRDDGVRYIPDALARGARKIVVEDHVVLLQEVLDTLARHDAILERVCDGRAALAQMSAAAYDHPAKKLVLIGITGTKGKTTTSFLMAHILRECGHRVALLSTVHNRINDRIFPTELTTQHADYLHAFLHEAVCDGVTHVVVEAAAQAFTLQRVTGLEFQIAAWLNFSQEHGEFYETQADYFAAKACIKEYVVSGGILLLSAYDEHLKTLPVPAGIRRLFFDKQNVVVHKDFAKPRVGCHYDDIYYECVGIAGAYNGENLLAAVIMAREVGCTAAQISMALQDFAGVPGRFNLYALPNGAICCIDYAHNPSSIEAVLSELRQYTDDLIVVSGAGGDRDKTKRPEMGALIARYAQMVILTSDNPRTEDPAAIVQDMLSGIQHHDAILIELDRERAIRRAYELSRHGSLIALLGKGPDEYQIIQGKKEFFSEQQIVKSL